MDLEEFLKYPVTLTQINNYFSYCLDNNIIFNDKELDRLKLLYSELVKEYPDMDFTNIKKIVILSTRYEYEISCNFIVNNKDISSLNKNETYNNIFTLIDLSFDDLFNDDIEMLFYKYLSFNVNIRTINNIVYSVDEKLSSRLKIIMDNNYNVILQNIYDELVKDDLDISKLNSLIDYFVKWKDNCNFCYLNYVLVKKIIKFWNDDLYSNGLFNHYFRTLKCKFLNKLYFIMDDTIKDKFINDNILDGNISINNDIFNKNFNFNYDTNSTINSSNIIKVSNDCAFSINKIDKGYILDVFVSNVIDFLLNNKNMIDPIYNIGCSIGGIEMIPYKELYINEKSFTDVFDFNFVFNNNGSLLLSNVKKTKIKANVTLGLNTLEQNYKEFLEEINPNSNNCYELISNIVNYHIGYNSSFAIYNNGIYTINRKICNTDSINSTSRFSSIINLVFYLTQIGLIKCDDKYLYKIIDNIDEIINHLNERRMISEYAKRHPKSINKVLSKTKFLKK